MSKSQHFLFLSSISLPFGVILVGDPGLAVTLVTPTTTLPPTCSLTSTYCQSTTYQQANIGTSQVSVRPLTVVPSGTRSYFFSSSTLLDPWKQAGWSFQLAPTALSGSFRIDRYYPIYGTPGGSTYINIYSWLQFAYQPTGSDPQLSSSGLDWIQFVTTNYSTRTYIDEANGNQIKNDGTYTGASFTTKVDIVEEQSFSGYQNSQYPKIFDPFYSTFFTSGTYGVFRDVPTRPLTPGYATPPPIQSPIVWDAYVFLIRKTGPKTITIYDGIFWGWKNTFTSVNGSGGGGGGEDPPTCDGQNYGCATDGLLASRFTDERGYHVTEPSTSVPEPSSALALLVTGVLYGGSRLRKGKVKGSSQRKASPSNFVPKVPPFLLDKYQHSRQQRLSQDASLHGLNPERVVRNTQPQTEIHKEAQIKVLAGVKLPACPEILIDSPMCSLESTHATQQLALLQSHLHSSDIVLELGAPDGLISTYCAQQISSDRVFVYESDAACVEQLQATYALNDVSPCLKRYCTRGLLNRGTLGQRIKEINPTFLILNEDIEDVWAILRLVELQLVEKLLINLPVVNETALQEMCEYLAVIGFQVQEELTLGQEFFFTKAQVGCLTSEPLLSSSTV